MKALVFHGIGDFRLEVVSDPRLEQPTDAIVRITASAICSTDLPTVVPAITHRVTTPIPTDLRQAPHSSAARRRPVPTPNSRRSTRVPFANVGLVMLPDRRHRRLGTPQHVEVRLDGLVLGFASIEAARRVHRLDVDAGPKRFEVVLWTDNVDAVFARLVAGGATVISPPHDFEPEGVGRLRVAWITDPDGGAVQLVTEVPVTAVAGT